MRIVLDNLRLVSEANVHRHWRGRSRRAKFLREAVTAELVQCRSDIPPLPVTVTMTRIAPRPLDGDNLRPAFKAVRDAVADRLLPLSGGNRDLRWADDSDERITWVYSQRRGHPKEYAVEIDIDQRPLDVIELVEREHGT